MHGHAMAKKKAAKKKSARTSARSRAGWTWAPAKPKPSGAVYQFRITLLDTHPPIWRRIQITDCFLDDLHWHIQAAMGWENSHFHHFTVDGVVFEPPREHIFADDYEAGDSTLTLLSMVVPDSRARCVFRYVYDFGDDWVHEIRYEWRMKTPGTATLPVCLEGEHACPPEDCGGISGYEHMLQVLADPEDDEYGETLEWIGGDFDPEEFDAKKATLRMRRGLRA